MAEFSGSSLVVNWIHSGGTVDLSGDYRSFNFPPEREMLDKTAGSDAGRGYLASVWNYTCALTAVMQTGGTAVEDALISGRDGTLIVQPEGTATGKRKYTIPAMSKGASFNFQYDAVVELACSFQSQGAPTYSTN
jgi:hypothetical protein